MKSVVMIAYSFPPEGHAGMHRPLRFVRHLTALGWSADVISSEIDRYSSRYDPGLLTMVPSDTKVIRVPRRDPWQAIQGWRGQRIQKRIASAPAETVKRLHAAQYVPVRSFIREVVRTVEAWCYHPDMAMCWIRPAVEAIVQICARKRPDVIWATGGPWSSFIVAQRASRRTGVPYVVDFRDPWTIAFGDFETRRPAWAKLADERALSRILEGARATVFLFDTVAECYWRAYRGALDASKIHIIPNGYEGKIDEFRPPPHGEKCAILYAGTSSGYRYDTLFQSLHWLKNAQPARAQQLRLLFVGEGTEALAKEAAALRLTDIVTTANPVPHAEATRLQWEAHVLLMLGQPPSKGYELFASSKLFGYLKAGRPILGVLPRNEAKKILHRVGVSTVADVDSPSEIVAVLQRLLDAWSAGTLSSLVPNRSACEAYSAERQTAALIRALEGVPAAEPFVPGSVDIPPSLREDIGDGGWTSDYRRT